MKVVALVRAPTEVQSAVASLAEAAGMTLAEARMRLAPEPPALLARLAPDAADALVASLSRQGLSVVAVDERRLGAPHLVARRVAFTPAAATFTPRTGEPWELPWRDVVAVLRGSSSMRTVTENTEQPSRMDTAKAYAKTLVSHGLIPLRNGEKTVRKEAEETSQVIYVFARDGRGVVLGEHGVDFSCLGPAMQPVRTANMGVLMRQLCEHTPDAFHDERLMRLGRRPLPFVVSDSTQLATGKVSVSRVNTVHGLDVLAEVMRQGVMQGMLG
ncbi:hypothetical protein LZ198_08535 [Myxococcus sp. K15C18031901]|uniref:hypothetical protein n=1 Tax=Myxococcus dinghuensis TaxID=2906761 RepID=UPI0020A823F0|nr:hypothetical protein [Myxococcus dinghuensis]MCP3098921.1 hypothetical protein [Myxococcus dinghuensis]